MKEDQKCRDAFEYFRKKTELPEDLWNIGQDEYKRSISEGLNEEVSSYSRATIRTFFCGFKAGIESLNIPKHETVEQWETRTGESYPGDGPVWVKRSHKDNEGEYSWWELNTYKASIPWGSKEVVYKFMKLNKDNFVVANHHGKPEV